jgi:hypothetical protein
MQHYVRVHLALHDGLIEGAVVTVAMQLERDLVIIVLQSYNLSLPMGGYVAQLRARFVAGAAIGPDSALKPADTQAASDAPVDATTRTEKADVLSS